MDVRINGKHRDGCHGGGYWCPVVNVFRDKRGGQRGRTTMFLQLTCNDPTCLAEALVSAEAISEMIERSTGKEPK